MISSESNSSIYKMAKLLPILGSRDVIIPTNSSTDSTFVLSPGTVFNLSKSSLSFTFTPIAGGVGDFNCVIADVIPTIQQLQLYTRGGIYLADIRYFDNYSKACLKKEMKLNDFLTKSVITPYIDSALDTDKLRDDNVLYRCNSIVGELRIDNNCIYGEIGTDICGDVASVNYTEPQYITAGNTNNASPVINYLIELKDIFNSIFSCDTNLAFDDEIYLRIVWNSPSKYIFNSTNPNNLVDANVEQYAGTSITISNLNLYLAMEANQSVVKSVISKKNNGGLSLIIPYLYSYKTPLIGSSQKVSFSLSKEHGKTLCKVFHLVASPIESAISTYDTYNVGGYRLSSFFTSIDGNRLQEINVDCTRLQDWLLMKDKLKGSVIQSSRMYQMNWFWEDDFSQGKLYHELCGLDLSTSKMWDIQMVIPDTLNAAAASKRNNYTFAVVQKILKIKSNSIELS